MSDNTDQEFDDVLNEMWNTGDFGLPIQEAYILERPSINERKNGKKLITAKKNGPSKEARKENEKPEENDGNVQGKEKRER